jgi:hypothetical protein
MNNNILSDEIGNKPWYIQHPTEEDNTDTQSTSNVDFSSRIICKNSFSFCFFVY